MTVDNLRKLDINPEDVVGIGVTNQRETTIVWNSITGQPLYSAIGKFRPIKPKVKAVTLVEQLASHRNNGLHCHSTLLKCRFLLQNLNY